MLLCCLGCAWDISLADVACDPMTDWCCSAASLRWA